jgi:hypothetical protein
VVVELKDDVDFSQWFAGDFPGPDGSVCGFTAIGQADTWVGLMRSNIKTI